MKTLKDEIVEVLKEASMDYRAQAMACCAGILPRRFYEEHKDKAERMEIIAAKVESARCEECSVKDELLNSAEREARSLAISLWKQYYQKESPNFELCDSTAGIITQINNMVAGIIEGYTTQQTLLKEMAEALEGLVTYIDTPDEWVRCRNQAKDILQKYHEQIGEPK